MKTLFSSNTPTRWRVVATFGSASLVSNSDGGMELRGGTPEEVSSAKEWISLFMHDAVPQYVAARAVWDRAA